MTATKTPIKNPVDLLLDNGEIVRIEVPMNHEDAFFEAVEHQMKRREWLCFNRWEGCTAELFGLSIDRLHMGRVVAML